MYRDVSIEKWEEYNRFFLNNFHNLLYIILQRLSIIQYLYTD